MNKSMENWLRCNKCYRLVKKSKKTYSLTQCQHVFCSTCITKAEKQCPECNSLGVKTVPLVKPLPQPLQHYFGSVGGLVQQCLEAARFQRTQSAIALRRFDEIQRKYEDMKRTYYQSAQEMKSLMAAYTQLKQKNAKIKAVINQHQTMEPVRTTGTESSNYMRMPDNQRVHQSQRMMGYAMAGNSQIGVTRNDARASPSLSSSRNSIATPSAEHSNWHNSLHNHAAPNPYQNRPKPQAPGHRYSPIPENAIPQYPTRAISSYALSSNRDTQRVDSGWIGRNRIPESLGESSAFSSFTGTIDDSPTIMGNYSDYRRH